MKYEVPALLEQNKGSKNAVGGLEGSWGGFWGFWGGLGEAFWRSWAAFGMPLGLPGELLGCLWGSLGCSWGGFWGPWGLSVVIFVTLEVFLDDFLGILMFSSIFRAVQGVEGVLE